MSLTWSSKRKLTYFSIVVGIILAGAFVMIYPYFNQEPTCFDAKKNGDESGVDCGGSCFRVCTAEAYRIVPLWARAFEVVPGKYNLMAYIENQNREAGIAKIGYEFRVYDENNIFLARREGTTFISSNDRTAIFEAGIEAGNRKPSRVDFTFTGAPSWVKINRDQRNSLAISVEDKVLTDALDAPKLRANVSNNTLINMRYLDVFAILYDENDNVLTVSKTLVEDLPKSKKVPVVFTWPKGLEKAPTRIDIFPQVNIFELGL